MSLFDDLPHRFQIKRPRYVMDKLSGDDADYTVIKTDIPGWYQSASASEILEFQKRDMVVTHKIYIQSEQPARSGDILIALTGPYVGQVCAFTAQSECTAGLDVGWKIMVENVR